MGTNAAPGRAVAPIDDQEFFRSCKGGVIDDIHLFEEKLREREDYDKLLRNVCVFRFEPWRSRRESDTRTR